MRMNRRIKTREKIEQLTGKIILMLLQSVLFTAGLCCCLWFTGVLVNIMEHNLFVAIVFIGIVIRMLIKEIM